jgi:type II secretory pathway pseudopilin PulG
MTRGGVAALALAGIVALTVAPTAIAQQEQTVVAQQQIVAVTVAPEHIATRLGSKFAFTSSIANNGATDARGLIAHLNVLSLKNGTYVDPEDWSSNRTRYLAPIPAGESTTITWRMQAVNDGDFGIYVAVLPDDGAPVPPVTGPTIRLDVAERKTLNAGGIVPLVLGIPAALGILALAVRLRRRG